MSRKIAIVGARRSGLPLAIALQSRGDQITLLTNRTSDDLRNGKVLSSQCMFDASLQIERDFGLNQWEHLCPPAQGIGLAVPRRTGMPRPRTSASRYQAGWNCSASAAASSCCRTPASPSWKNWPRPTT
jgi:hypothetical protein